MQKFNDTSPYCGRVSAILNLVGHIQLTKASPQGQFQTISSSKLT